MTRHLIHIGFPKTGSNYLRAWFTAHPQLGYAAGGIAGYQDVYAIVEKAAPFRYRVTSYEGLSTPRFVAQMGEAQAEVCTTLAELFPNARVLVITRGYKSMVLSSYSQFLRNGGELDFSGFCAGITLSDNPWHYDRLLALYRSAFGNDEVIALPYELLREDAGAFIRTLALRLGVDTLATHLPSLNERISPEEMAWYAQLNRAAKLLPRRLRHAYARAALKGSLTRVTRILQYVRPAIPVTADAIPCGLLETLQLGAEELRRDPLYARYQTDYLG